MHTWCWQMQAFKGPTLHLASSWFWSLSASSLSSWCGEGQLSQWKKQQLLFIAIHSCSVYSLSLSYAFLGVGGMGWGGVRGQATLALQWWNEPVEECILLSFLLFLVLYFHHVIIFSFSSHPHPLFWFCLFLSVSAFFLFLFCPLYFVARKLIMCYQDLSDRPWLANQYAQS